jgi:hypothetical protein
VAGNFYQNLPALTLSGTGTTWPFVDEYGDTDVILPSWIISSVGLTGEVGATGENFLGFPEDDVTLPMLEVEAEGLTELIGTFDEELPMITISAILLTGMVEMGEIDLPPPVLSATGLTGFLGTADLDLPALTAIVNLDEPLEIPVLEVDGDGLTGWVGTLEYNLPSITESGISYGNELGTVEVDLPSFTISSILLHGNAATLDVILPLLQISASQEPHEDLTGTVDIVLPSLRLTGTATHVETNTIVGNISLPVFQINAELLFGNLVETELNLPSMTLSATGFGGETGVLDQELPVFTVSSTGYVSGVTGTTAVNLPIFDIEAQGISSTEIEPLVISDVYVVNTNNFGVTEYSNFRFNSYCYFNGIYLGAKSDGIFRLDQEDDVGTDITMTLEKTKMDLGNNQIKRATDAYFTLTSDGEYLFKMIADKLSHTYHLRNGYEGLRNEKLSIGKGLKGRWLGFNFQNVRGSDITLDQILLLGEVLSRRVRNV